MRTTLFITLCYIGYVGQMYVENQFGIQLIDPPTWMMVGIMALAFMGDLKDLFYDDGKLVPEIIESESEFKDFREGKAISADLAMRVMKGDEDAIRELRSSKS